MRTLAQILQLTLKLAILLSDMMLIQKHTQQTRHLTTAHLTQTMSLLEMPVMELRQKIEAALADNPALELVEERSCPRCGKPLLSGSCPLCSRQASASADQAIVFVSSRNDLYQSRSSQSNEDEDSNYEDFTPENITLAEFVLRQVATELQPEDRPIAAYILSALDDNGLLGVSLVEIALYLRVSLSHAQKVLKLIQRADPPGVAAETPKEALLIQLDHLSETQTIPELTYKIIQQGFEHLGRKQYQELSRLLGSPEYRIRQAAHFITDNLNPYPAHGHWGTTTGRFGNDRSQTSVYYFPDIIISLLDHKQDSPLVIEIAMPISGALSINPLFRQVLSEAPDDKAEKWKADWNQAELLVKCLQQRNHTMIRLMELVARIQRNYILFGDASLQPLTRAQVAKELNLHESTISRAVADKAIQMPNGRILPLARFFDRSLPVRTVLRQIIDSEPKPLSDAELVIRLKDQGYTVARRTVAKYRSIEGILPVHIRTQEKCLLSPDVK